MEVGNCSVGKVFLFYVWVFHSLRGFPVTSCNGCWTGMKTLFSGDTVSNNDLSEVLKFPNSLQIKNDIFRWS